MKENKQTIVFGAVLLFFICYFMQLFNFPNELTVVGGGLLCLIMVLVQKCIRIDLGVCLLAVTMISYYVIQNGMSGLFYSIAYIPLVVYLLAEYTAKSISKDDSGRKKLLLLIFVMVLGYTIHGILNSYMYYAGYVVPGTRRWQDFWSGTIVPGTQHSAYYLPALAVFLTSVLYFKERKLFHGGIIVISAFFCYTALVTKSRMQLVVFVLVFGVQLLLFLLLEKEKTRKLLKNKVTWILLALMAALLVVAFLLVKDTEVVASFIDNLGADGGILKNARFDAQRLALTQLFEFPMGGRAMDFGALHQYCHNTWLDMANAAGLIPFFAFSAYTVYSAVGMLRFMGLSGISRETKIIVFGLYCAFFLYLTVEPAMDASIHLITPWIFVNGVVRGTFSKCKNLEITWEKK